jgi:hypothetical protein
MVGPWDSVTGFGSLLKTRGRDVYCVMHVAIAVGVFSLIALCWFSEVVRHITDGQIDTEKHWLVSAANRS